MQLREKLRHFGVIPVITLTQVEDAIPVAQALSDGGLPVAEITFRTPAAAEAIAAVKRALPHMIIGAGTILTLAQLHQARVAGADFMVSPGFDATLIEKSLRMEMPFIPGCATATEIGAAQTLGIDLVKFFPAAAQNAQAVIPAMAGPFPDITYMLTGGIGFRVLNTYLSLPNVICCGGSWIAPTVLIDAGNFTEIQKNATATVETITRIRKGCKDEQ
ncbi:bifunctional 4-hydroxy-2-oxoglutarate aldolase/2-dehydro-3-deoxy-phosphogluconate aldolase [Paremcibacter congregatus]|uniref:bifunctional 4-hydroxy-2-oxoglutarate aldolase/2-dehydro-3-deoxy-phosphogluconate aldolase n=1 Tax=Paremcibacter congregatus TaxID=2043170 RepID=UPI003A932AAE